MHGRSEYRLADSHATLAEVLKRAGYETAAFVSAFPVTERFGLHQGFDVFDAGFMTTPPEQLVSKTGIVSTGGSQRRADATTDRALLWLAEARSPHFVWLHYFAFLAVAVAVAQPRLAPVWFVPLAMVITPGSGQPSPLETLATLAIAALTFLLAVRASRRTVVTVADRASHSRSHVEPRSLRRSQTLRADSQEAGT